MYYRKQSGMDEHFRPHEISNVFSHLKDQIANRKGLGIRFQR